MGIKTDISKLVESYAKMLYSAKLNAPIKIQKRLYDSFYSKLQKMSIKYSDFDLSSSKFFDELERRAVKFWNSKAIHGPGIDW